MSLREDAEPGTLVATLTATDADLEPAFRLMTFAITAGDAEGLFGLVWEPESTHVQLQLLKVRCCRWGGDPHTTLVPYHGHTMTQSPLILETQL